MRYKIITLLIFIPFFAISQQKNIIGFYGGYEYREAHGNYLGGFDRVKQGFNIGSNYEKFLKNNWWLGGGLEYSCVFQKTYIKHSINNGKIYFKATKYFGNRFFQLVSFGQGHEITVWVSKDFVTKGYSKSYEIFCFPLFVELGCGYWLKENLGIFATAKCSYDILNFLNITHLYTNYVLNFNVGVKYKFGKILL